MTIKSSETIYSPSETETVIGPKTPCDCGAQVINPLPSIASPSGLLLTLKSKTRLSTSSAWTW